ncbi:hypothetical protein [uncultured Desulfuromonas sp.]|uniref:hypothetical protein n=1 Tax=uncultured Desulfuromonas sp. TaxID=181013 RepID=UPI002AABD66C|nr:hypothetical protein [uncultured Desulfuromonas sp.]
MSTQVSEQVKPQRYCASFEMEIDVTFSDPKKAEEFFIHGDWKDSFWTIDDLEELTESLAMAFHVQPEDYSKEHCGFVRSVEGFGIFVLDKDNSRRWVSSSIEGIEIVAEYEEELYVSHVKEVKS